MNKYIKEPKGKHYTPQRMLYLQCWCFECILRIRTGTRKNILGADIVNQLVFTECPDCGNSLCARVANHTNDCDDGRGATFV